VNIGDIDICNLPTQVIDESDDFFARADIFKEIDNLQGSF
jgi:hypothetical protein